MHCKEKAEDNNGTDVRMFCAFVCILHVSHPVMNPFKPSAFYCVLIR